MAFQRLQSFLALCVALGTAAFAQTIVLTPSTTLISADGGSVTFTATITYATKPTTMGLTVTLPSGWAYLSGTSVPGASSEPAITPSVGTTDELGWAFVTTPSSPVSFTFTASYPANSVGPLTLTSTLVTRDGSGGLPTTVFGPTLTLPTQSAWAGGNGVWSNAAMWGPNGVPNNSGSNHFSATVSAGIAAVDTAVVLDNLTFSGGTISGTSPLTLTGVYSTWSGSGQFTDVGELIIASGAQIVASGNTAHDFSQHTIRNQGTFTWTDRGALQSGNGGQFINSAGATFVDATSGIVDYLITNTTGGTFTFSNAGTFSKTSSSSTRITIPFSNTGNIVVSAGTLRFSGAFTQGSNPASPVGANTPALAAAATAAASGIFVASGATLQFDQGLNLASGSLTGGGTVIANITNSGFISPGNTIGTMFVQGNLGLLSTSQLSFDIAGATQGTGYDFLSVNGAATLGGNFSFNIIAGAENTILPTSTLTLLSATSVTGTFVGIPDGSRIAALQGIGSFVVNYTPTSVTLTQFSPIPEPSTWMLLGTGVAAFGLRRWRSRSKA